MHVDMDAFYASVEELDRPELAGEPVIVGGLGPRGVVATANYAARKFGARSAMPMTRARRLCPQAHFIRPRMSRYREASDAIFECFRRYTPQVEGLSLDEAFLDVTASLKLFGGMECAGRALKKDILTSTGLTASAGMAHNKFLAKLASDMGKPNGFVLVSPSKVHSFLDPMPIGRLWGIGAKTEPRLRALGILTIGQLRRTDRTVLQPVLGNRADHFQRLANGIDFREVMAERAEKSISHEITFDQDILERDTLLAELQRQSEDVSRRLRHQNLAARTVVVKIRDGRFRTVTRSSSLRAASNSTLTIYRMARALFESWRKQHVSTAVRLLGMGVSGLENSSDDGDQLENAGEQKIDRVVDEISDKYGTDIIRHALSMSKRKE
jgi:DNA polymerase-4